MTKIVTKSTKPLKIYRAHFSGVWPVGTTLVLAAEDEAHATVMTKNTIRHTNDFVLEEIDISKPCIIEYLSGEY